jgi:CRP-like cAMP-binding protein
MSEMSAIERFMAATWFVDIDSSTRKVILDSLVEARASSGGLLLEQGQPNDHLTFLIEGSAEIVRKFPDGRREKITELTAPAMFGTTSFFQPQPPTVSVRATTDVRMLTLYHPAHEQLRKRDPAAAEALALTVVRVLSERFDLIEKRFSEYVASPPNPGDHVSEWASFRARLFDERGM